MNKNQIQATSLLLTAAAFLLFSGCAASSQSSAGFKPLVTSSNRADWFVVLSGRPLPADTNRLVHVEQNLIHMYPGQANGSAQPYGYITTKREFSDYHLRFEYRWGTNRFGSRTTTKRDAGVIFHAFGPDIVWPAGVECQVQEGDTGDIFTVRTRVTTTVSPASTKVAAANQEPSLQFLEASQGGVPFVQGMETGIRRVARNPVNEHAGWNTVEVIVHGGTATYLVNGKVNNRVLAMEKFVDGKWTPLTRGRILFQLEFSEVFYRNIELKELAP